MTQPLPPPRISDPTYLRRTRKRAWLRALLAVLGIASIYFVGWLNFKTNILVPIPELHWTPPVHQMEPCTLRISGLDFHGVQRLERGELFRAFVLSDSLDTRMVTEAYHESSLEILGFDSTNKAWQSSLLGRFHGWETPVGGGSRLRTMVACYGDSCLILQTIDTIAEFQQERRLEARGWLRSTGIGYPWVVLYVALLMLLAVVAFMLFVIKGFLWSMRVEPPDLVEALPADVLSDRLRSLVPLAENRGFHEKSPGVFQCAWSRRGNRTRKLREYDVESDDWMRLRLDSKKSTAYLIAGSTVTTRRNDVFNFFRAREWMRSAGHLPITPIENPWIVWDGNAFVVTRTRDQDVGELAQALCHCVLDSGWRVQPSLW